MTTTMYQIEKAAPNGDWKPIGPLFPSGTEAELARIEWLADVVTRVVPMIVEITRGAK